MLVLVAVAVLVFVDNYRFSGRAHRPAPTGAHVWIINLPPPRVSQCAAVCSTEACPGRSPLPSEQLQRYIEETERCGGGMGQAHAEPWVKKKTRGKEGKQRRSDGEEGGQRGSDRRPLRTDHVYTVFVSSGLVWSPSPAAPLVSLQCQDLFLSHLITSPNSNSVLHYYHHHHHRQNNPQSIHTTRRLGTHQPTHYLDYRSDHHHARPPPQRQPEPSSKPFTPPFHILPAVLHLCAPPACHPPGDHRGVHVLVDASINPSLLFLSTLSCSQLRPHWIWHTPPPLVSTSRTNPPGSVAQGCLLHAAHCFCSVGARWLAPPASLLLAQLMLYA
ncbi:hypothetical protein B0J11DRAFT_500373 [Dendryphion nanum]|uniref:Uncharacterized protein n=1 Tax=Dendryphion nanum TaxID=256645 RepID=A0A9P9EJB3_9PLEO|nr:hypothetical protein B0J11DRAFT_500373 [Dendryphion nanum]